MTTGAIQSTIRTPVGIAPSADTALPSLTSGGQQPTTPAGSSDGAASAAPQAPAFNLTSLLSQGRWMGPLMVIGGGALALMTGSKFLKFTGITSALSGVALTGLGFKAKGIEDGTKATEAQAVQAMQALTQQYETSLASMQAQAGQQQTGQGTGTGTGTSTTPVGIGLEGTAVPGAGTQPATTQPTGQWSMQSLLGRSVQLAAGTTPSGTTIADAGSYRLEQIAGDANGYATLDEANTAARATMSTELMGSKFLRWMVVEHGGRYYGAIAKQLGAQDQAAALTSQLGTVVAWSAMNHVYDGGANGWIAYSWSQPAGAQVTHVPYGATTVFGGGVGVSGGGQVAAATATSAPFDQASVIGRSFAINDAAVADGGAARGGTLQIQQVVSGGHATPEEAAAVARGARQAAGGGGTWDRWVTLAGADGRYHVYRGSIVNAPTPELQGAAALHVFGNGFAEYFDGSAVSWMAVRDAA